MISRAAAIFLIFATASPGKAEEAAAPPASLREAVDLMLSVRDSTEKLEEAIRTARDLGATEQAALEARFLFHVDRHEDEAIAALAPEFTKRKPLFRLEDSEIFGVEEDWLAVVEYVLAIAALEKGDRDGFKRHITEAFWLSPKQGAAFAPHIDRLRLEDAMKNVRVDLQQEKTSLDDRKLRLANILGERKALFLHFFSPWSRECEESLPDFATAAKALNAAGLAVATIIGESSPEVRQETLALLAATNSPPPGTWLLDDPSAPLARQLRVQSAPTMVLVSREGAVLFHGHPSDDGLWEAVSKIAPEFQRPAIKEDGH
ncbi:MAG: redoxin domain-containing protein [Akkermansiaceae bacterium]|jgi:hypothetical protein|nr:redoxin domain-containing protein [Akkermansiaceae bacterium]